MSRVARSSPSPRARFASFVSVCSSRVGRPGCAARDARFLWVIRWSTACVTTIRESFLGSVFLLIASAPTRGRVGNPVAENVPRRRRAGEDETTERRNDETGTGREISRISRRTSGSMSKACSLPFGPSADNIPRVCPPRPNVPSTYVPFGSGATSARIVSDNIAGVCVPAAWSVPRTPNVPVFATVMLRCLPPNLTPSFANAASRECSAANVTNPAPLHWPVAGWRRRRTSPRRGPNCEKNSATSRSSDECGRYLTKTSYPSPSLPCVGAFVAAVSGTEGTEGTEGMDRRDAGASPRNSSERAASRGASHRKHEARRAKLTDPHAHVQSFAPVSFREALPGGGMPNGRAVDGACRFGSNPETPETPETPRRVRRRQSRFWRQSFAPRSRLGRLRRRARGLPRRCF